MREGWRRRSFVPPGLFFLFDRTPCWRMGLYSGAAPRRGNPPPQEAAWGADSEWRRIGADWGQVEDPPQAAGYMGVLL